MTITRYVFVQIEILDAPDGNGGVTKVSAEVAAKMVQQTLNDVRNDWWDTFTGEIKVTGTDEY